ncbi:DUF6221 family protein [Microbispora sp. GKU 823]|uniref:DUF6221 family protein n=1 Tax=Microbispora sp. GKU 823 TaxID=1652100 RepID=UPI0009A44EFC|nr:DUF6221 family protein [Microbispora sp. GKU 823]OPG13654.1 hypothetical protein B1L11_06615 [Microbispora sp. GKU 823]
MNELITWLRATIEGDLAKAKAANDSSVEWAAQYAGDCALDAEAEHIQANLPRDAVARCEADLAILDEHAPGWVGLKMERQVCMVHDPRSGDSWPCRTVRLLARGYRHRPGWQQGWAP